MIFRRLEGTPNVLVCRGPALTLVAGRCASMTQAGQSAARVSGGCFVMGQAAGAAAVMALAQNSKARAIDVRSLQARLEREGAYLGRDVA